jgi:membrane fusion protein (multidrug efflux system)
VESTAFERSFLRLAQDRAIGASVAAGIGVAILLAWAVWAWSARVWLLATSTEAHVELDATPYAIASPFVGRVVSSHLRLGSRVNGGDVLVEIDASSERLQARRARLKAEGFAPQAQRLQAQVDAEREAGRQQRVSAAAAALEADSRVREAEVAAALAVSEDHRVRSLGTDGMVSKRALDLAVADVRRLDAALGTARAAAVRVREEQATRDREREVRVERLQGEQALLASERDVALALAAQFDNEVERRKIRAPVAGRIAEAAPLREGAVLDEGDRLGTLVADDHRLRLVAQFAAHTAFGRIRAGQEAVLRLDGFPWTQYGSVPAVVADVAQETRDGSVRVELALRPGPTGPVALANGMPGRVEVRVEQLSPLSLLTRNAGHWLTQQP